MKYEDNLKLTLQEEETLKSAKKMLLLPACVNEKLLFEALCHKSYVFDNENIQRRLNSNERLEFLGDAVLELVISEFLHNNYYLSEGEMSKARAIIGSEVILAEVALKLGLDNFIFLSKGEDKQSGRRKKSILSDTMEAVFACIYISCGYEKVKKYIIKNMKEYIENAVGGNIFLDYKTRLQEITQEKAKKLPEYVLLNASGPSHMKRYKVAVKLGDEILGIGEGFSKKIAEQLAAKIACEKFLDSVGENNGVD
ncbi:MULTISPECIES: ribonuclease III [Petrotoga]|uniref:Ribonuclease 3 n=2 Tax=Petrotoga sibirica TaxID=156202 RepID=A0A4R8EGV7_9BACT|nr:MULTISPECIES: ribonuclease III [Petrotoga]POZ87807.1 ribonuclease III [Petrotoga sibirica DSM 13575]POZ89847.1 ribonuclease III [Petrotoga sp. SL27]TDX11124.1 RNAse III [Petrotoga sibirica]